MTNTKKLYLDSITSGINLGSEQMAELINKLNSKLFEAGRFDDAKRASNEPDFQKELMKEFGLELSTDIPDNMLPDFQQYL